MQYLMQPICFMHSCASCLGKVHFLLWDREVHPKKWDPWGGSTLILKVGKGGSSLFFHSGLCKCVQLQH